MVPFKEVRRKKWKVTPRAALVLLLARTAPLLKKAARHLFLPAWAHFSRGTIHKNDLLIAIKGLSAFSSLESTIFHSQLSIRKLSFRLLFLKITQRNAKKCSAHRQFMDSLTQNKPRIYKSISSTSFGGPIKKRTHKHCVWKIPPNLWRSIIMNTENSNRRKKRWPRSLTTKRRGILGRRRQPKQGVCHLCQAIYNERAGRLIFPWNIRVEI